MKRSQLRSFLLIFLLAAGLRIAGITFDSLWLDESYQTFVETVAGSLPDFTHPTDSPFLFKFGEPQAVGRVISNFRAVDPLCPPLYAVLLNRWLTAFGESDLAARSLSTVLSLLSLAIVYFLASWAINARAALLASLLQAVSPFDIYYAQEARMYGLEILASSLSCASLLFLLTQLSIKRDSPDQTSGRRPPVGPLSSGESTGLNPGSAQEASSIAASSPMEAGAGGEFQLSVPLAAVVYTASSWALINSHYTALFVIAFQGLFSTWHCLRQRNLRLFSLLALCWGGILLLWMPWFELFRQAASVRTESFYVARKASWWWPLWAAIARIPFNWIVFLSGKQVVAYAIPVYCTSAAFIGAAAWSSLKPGQPSIQSRAKSLSLRFLWAWAIMPPLMVWLLDLTEGHRVVEIARYVMATAPAIYILTGYGIAALYTVRAWAPAVVLVHIVFALVNNTYAHLVPQREPWREMARLVESLVRPDEPLLVSQYYDIVCLDRYLNHPFVQYGVSPSLPADHLARVLSGRKSFWLLTAQEGEAIKNMIPTRYKLIRQVDLRHALHLRLYEEPDSAD